MGIVHGGSIAFPSTFIRTGYNQLPSQPGISSGAPIDQREVVDNKSDLISETVWTANGGDTRYQGMIVHVFSEHKSYILVNVTQKSSYDGWKPIGAFDNGDNFKVLTGNGTASEPSFQFVTGNSFDNQNANVVFAGPSSDSAAKPTFRSLVGADLPTATASVKGAVTPGAVRTSAITTTTGGTTENRYFGVELDSNGKMFVNVPGVTSVRVQGSDIIDSSTSTASTTTLNTTISIKKADQHKVLTGNGTASEPSFQFITGNNFGTAITANTIFGVKGNTAGTPEFTSAANLWAIEDAGAAAGASGYLKKDSNGWSLGEVSTTDTKNTAGSTNTNNKIYLVGPTSKSAGTTADPDDHQTYTNGENYIGTDNRLYTINKRVALEEDVEAINDLLDILEQWPTITHTVNSVSDVPDPIATLKTPPILIEKFRATANGEIQITTNITANPQAVKVGSSITVYNAITVQDTTTFSQSNSDTTPNTRRVTGTTSLEGFTNGWRTTETGDITRTPTTVTSSAYDDVTYTKNDKAKTSDSNLVLELDGTTVKTVIGASGVNNLTIPTTTNPLTTSLTKGQHTIKVTHNCPSTYSRSAASYTIPRISKYNVSSLDRSNSAHVETEGENRTGYPGKTATAASTSKTLTIYGVYPIFSTAGTITTKEQDAKTGASSATTGPTNTNTYILSNYYTYNNDKTDVFFLFGSIPNGAENSNAKIFLPSDEDSEKNLRITDIKGYNSMSSVAWSVPMTLTGPTNVSVDGRTYKQYTISDSNSAGQGPNAYKVTIRR